MDFAQTGSRRAAQNKSFDQRMERAVAAGQVLTQEAGRKLDRDETVLLATLAPRGQLLPARKIKRRGPRLEHNRFLVASDRGAAIEVEAKFQALGMETARPVELLAQIELVRFDAHAQVMEIAVEPAPAVSEWLPHRRLGKGGVFGCTAELLLRPHKRRSYCFCSNHRLL